MLLLASTGATTDTADWGGAGCQAKQESIREQEKSQARSPVSSSCWGDLSPSL